MVNLDIFRNKKLENEIVLYKLILWKAKIQITKKVTVTKVQY